MRGPQPGGGFEWTPAPFGDVLRCRALEPLAGHFFTAASLQLRDDPREWEAVAALAGVPVSQLRLLHQVHGCRIMVADAGDGARPEADGIVTDDPSLALVVRVADCGPVLMADRRTGAVAAVHAGWRSTMQRIVIEAIDALRRHFHSDPADLVVALGPSLGGCCGEMGDEVIEAFRDAGHADSIDRWFRREPGRRAHFDLWQANADQLREAGVAGDAIHVAELCTRTHADTFHSYRAAGAAAGRMAAVVRCRR